MDSGRIRMLFHYNNSLSGEGSCTADSSSRHTSINGDDCNAIRTHPENLTILSQARDVRVPTPRNLLAPNPPNDEHTPAEILKKSIKIHVSLFSKSKGENV